MSYEINSLCPICGQHTFHVEFERCPICEWQQDNVQEADHTFDGVANELCVILYRAEWYYKLYDTERDAFEIDTPAGSKPKDLTQQMLADFKRYIKPERWDDFKRMRFIDIKLFGPIMNILDVYSVDGSELLCRRYQFEHDIGTDDGFELWGVNAGVENLNELLER